MHRADVTFPSEDGTCSAWLYRPAPKPGVCPPLVVLGHGLGGVKEMRLDAYAERFCVAGYACLVFDYRNFGASSGEPRQLLSISRQLADWRAAIAFARTLDNIDTDRIVLWGSSFGGGLVIDTAASDHAVAAVIAQCPFTDGFASMRATDLRSSLKVTVKAVADIITANWRRDPVRVALAGPPHSAALMTADDAQNGYRTLACNAPGFRNFVAARFGLAIPRYFPGRRTHDVRCPIYFAVCSHDTVAPARTTVRLARRAPHAEVAEYPFGHFDIYLGDAFERVVTDYLHFLDRHVPVTG